MARLPRFCPAGYPQHIIQRGNNRTICFDCNDDYACYACWLGEYAKAFDVSIHAWVFMTNHVHLLATPASDTGVSAMMQALGRRYVRYFNSRYARSGTLWEGRFKSCIVQTDVYLLAVYRYIELNPVRAGMVDNPLAHHWSSYATNALGVASSLCSPHATYSALGKSQAARLSAYRDLFSQNLPDNVLKEIRQAAQQQWPLGSNHFKNELEALYKRRMTAGRVGRKFTERTLCEM